MSRRWRCVRKRCGAEGDDSVRGRVTIRARFAAAYSLLAVCSVGCVIGLGVGLRGRLPVPAKHVSVVHPSCSDVGCAHLGDHVTYRLDGQVTQVSSPQPGVVCVQVSARTHGGDYCGLSGG